MDTSLACDCGRPIADNDQNSLKWGMCFKCRHLNGQELSLNFRGGGGYGQEAFHSGTNAEFLRENDGPGTIPFRG